MCEKPIDGVHKHVLPHQGGNGRHHKEWRDHQDSDDALSPHRLVEQQCQQYGEKDGDEQHTADDCKRCLNAWPK